MQERLSPGRKFSLIWSFFEQILSKFVITAKTNLFLITPKKPFSLLKTIRLRLRSGIVKHERGNLSLNLSQNLQITMQHHNRKQQICYKPENVFCNIRKTYQQKFQFKWNVTPLIRRGSNFYFFAAFYCTRFEVTACNL